MKRWLLLLLMVLAGCSSAPTVAPVQERSPVLPREILPAPPATPVSPARPGSPAAGNSAGARPVLPRPPASTATTGMMAPQPTGAGDELPAAGLPVRPDGASSGAVPATGPAAQPPATVQPPLAWSWPVDTPITQPYSDSRKGLDFSGALGQPVRAAARGTVAYVTESLRGYGLMVVIKHDNGYSSVYAHNKQIVVKEGQHVDRGQKIAEMGSTDSSEVRLHFELRHQGIAVDPARVLPPR